MLGLTGISFCSQMQGLVLVDQEGRALRRPMSYMDQRAGEVFRETQTHGVTISGVALPMLLKSLIRTRAASTSVKDPLWKYKWVQKNEPEVFSEAYKWLDVKEYLICRCTGEFVMTRDSAYSTFLYDTRKGHEGWSHALCSMYGVEEKHLPALIECTDVAGTLTEKAASELGLAAGTPRLRRRGRRHAHRRGRRRHAHGRHAYLFRHLRLGQHRHRRAEGRHRRDDRRYCRRAEREV